MCIFCAISLGEIPAEIVASDDRVVIFRDITPAAPNHFVVISRDHHDNIAQLTASDPELAGHLLVFAADVAKTHNPDGFRLVFNTGPDGGQSVEHVHLHILGGRHMQWPPG